MAHRDPVRLLAEELIAAGLLDEPTWKQLQEEVAETIDSDYLRAEKEQDPLAEEVMLHNLAKSPPPRFPPLPSGRSTMVQAIKRNLPEGPWRTIPKSSSSERTSKTRKRCLWAHKGLSESFPKQVFNSPLAEATIIGVAVGMAAYGWKPIFELQFIDFVAPAWNQLTTNMSSLRWRSFGHWKCPCVIYAPYGAYLPGGSLWHSQSNEGGDRPHPRHPSSHRDDRAEIDDLEVGAHFRDRLLCDSIQLPQVTTVTSLPA